MEKLSDQKLLDRVERVHAKSTFSSYFDMKYLEAKKGYFKAEVLITEKLSNSMGTCHGGATASIIDSLGGAVSYTLLSEEEYFSTMNFRVDFLAPIKLGAKLTGIAKVLRKGARIILVQVNLLNEKEELVANGTVSNLILKRK